MKRLRSSLRTGYTTGTCAAAAAKGAALVLAGTCVREIELILPGGETARVPVQASGCSADGAFCEVVKDAGDDPDITNGARIRATVRILETDDIIIAGGEGVGMVTRPGLAVAPGKPAINPMPERMIRSSVRDALMPGHGAHVTISVANGEELAKKTLNPRLGITGGISILGTTGLVIPYSHQAYRDSIVCALDVIQAMGLESVVLCTGRSSEKEARRVFSSLPEAAFVLMADYFSFAVQEAVRHGIARIIIAGFPGKLLKMAAGAECTHYRKADVDLALFAAIARRAGMNEEGARMAGTAHTARHAMELMPGEFHESVCARLTHMVHRRVRELGGFSASAEVLLFSYNGGVLFHEGKS
jgi:cobalt-precorrin-5B (C1)-methyltransferase